MINRLLIVILMILPVFANAEEPSLCKRLNLGWHFYCDEKKLQKEEAMRAAKEPTVEDARQELSQIQKKLEDLQIKSVIYPTNKNILEYIAFQNQLLERSEKFTNMWQKAIWRNPELDYMVKTPLSTVGHAVRDEMKKDTRAKVLQEVGKRYGLFFFYTTRCPYCIKYSPIVKVFAESYGISVLPVSLDDGVLPEWPDSEHNTGQLEAFGLTGKPVPITVLFDNKNKKLVIVGFGLLTVDELEDRIYKLISEMGV